MNESWIQIASLFMANAGLIIWFRTESRNDWRHMDNQVNAFRQELKALHVAILEESKDFHARLCKTEEARNAK